MNTREAVLRCFDMVQAGEIEEAIITTSTGTTVTAKADLKNLSGLTITVK